MRQHVAAGTRLALKLTDRERETLLKESLAPEELTRPLRLVPAKGQAAVVRYTLGELEELLGYAAAEANQAGAAGLWRAWEAICGKIEALVDGYVEGEGEG